MRNRLSDRLGNGFGYKSGRRYGKRTAALALAMCISVSLAGCGGKVKINDGTFRPVDEAAIMRLIRATKGGIVIPGVEYAEKARMSFRGK